MAKVKFGYTLGEYYLTFLLADHCNQLFRSMFPDSVIAKDLSVGERRPRLYSRLLLKSLCAVSDSQCFTLQTDETTDITVLSCLGILITPCERLGDSHALDKVRG